MKRFLVVGAGAALEECRQSGQYPDDPSWSMPLLKNFCSRLFDPTSSILMQVTASYLDRNGIPYDPRLLSLTAGDSFSDEDIARGPVGIFLALEARESHLHNIERLCEHVWQTLGSDHSAWTAFVHDGIFLKLFGIFTQQFGLGVGKRMRAGTRVGAKLKPNDQILNLNYDIAFDLALKQVNHATCYAPSLASGEILILKPHGSFNLYVNNSNGNFFFQRPDQIHGSVGIPDPEGGWFFVQDGIVPPRLNKTYKQHPIAELVLQTMRPVQAETVTFWGVGLTDSDIDLLDLYREAVGDAQRVEFINPSAADHEHASQLLGVDLHYFSTLESWLSQA